MGIGVAYFFVTQRSCLREAERVAVEFAGLSQAERLATPVEPNAVGQLLSVVQLGYAVPDSEDFAESVTCRFFNALGAGSRYEGRMQGYRLVLQSLQACADDETMEHIRGFVTPDESLASLFVAGGYEVNELAPGLGVSRRVLPQFARAVEAGAARFLGTTLRQRERMRVGLGTAEEFSEMMLESLALLARLAGPVSEDDVVFTTRLE